ncbi:MAG TPA: hypothetical protein VIH57_03605 [Bacteroidales bacterium]
MLPIKPNLSNFLYLTPTNNTNLPPPKWPEYQTKMETEGLESNQEKVNGTYVADKRKFAK